jgi:comEA protein
MLCHHLVYYSIFLEGHVMEHHLIRLAILLILGLHGMLPVTTMAADNAGPTKVLETIHLNQATADELQALPGVGPARSERIFLYRTKHGPFSTLDQLTAVKGIGQAKLAKLKGHLTLD